MTLAEVRRLFIEVNGDHPMTAADDDYVRQHFVPVPDDSIDLVMARSLPAPSYVTSDGTPMVHPDFLTLLDQTGSADELRSWFLDQWPATERDVAEAEWADYLSGQYVCLWSVTPTTIQAKTNAIEAIKAEVALLSEGGGSLERLRAAVDELDALEPPFTAYDRLRFGGPTSRDVWIDEVRAKYLD